MMFKGRSAVTRGVDPSPASVLQAGRSPVNPGSGSETGPGFRGCSSPEDACWCPESSDGAMMGREKGRNEAVCSHSQHGRDGSGSALSFWLISSLR